MLLRIKRLLKENNRGAALILAIFIVAMLFIFASFLVRRVLTNTVMVKKVKDEQTGYALAKKGILYALDRLNNSDKGEDWPGNSDWNNYNLDNDADTGDESGNDVSMKVSKNVPLSEYITIEAEDLPKKLVTLEGISNYTSPLLKYVRFINSDTTFGNNTFGDSGMIRGEAPFCILGDLTWQGTSNDITLTSPNVAKVSGSIINGGSAIVRINGSSPVSGYSYFTQSDRKRFDTAEGVYFDGHHLPSCYQYSGLFPPTPSDYYTGSVKSPFWPYINEERYKDLASGTNCYIDNADEINMKTEWLDYANDNDISTPYDNDTIDEWFDDADGSTNPAFTSVSYHYYPRAARLILNNNNLTEVLSGGTTNTINYSSITNDIIFAEGDISVSGIIPAGERLTIVSGGNIFIDSNLLKEDNNASLALLVKKHIVLNPTLRYAVGTGNTSTNESWYQPDYVLGNSDSNYASPTDSTGVTLPADGEKTYTLDIDMGKLVTSGRIALWDYKDAEETNLKTKLEVLITREDDPPADDSSWNQILTYTNVGTTSPYLINFIPKTFRWIRLNLRAHNTDDSSEHTFDLSNEQLDAIEVALYGINACLFAENDSLKVVTGGEVDQDNSILPNNDAYKTCGTPSGTDGNLTFWVTLAECFHEPIDEWTGTGASSKWPNIVYTYDSALASNPPPHLPPSVNLVSLRRK